jgi:hypothetical protein
MFGPTRRGWGSLSGTSLVDILLDHRVHCVGKVRQVGALASTIFDPRLCL